MKHHDKCLRMDIECPPNNPHLRFGRGTIWPWCMLQKDLQQPLVCNPWPKIVEVVKQGWEDENNLDIFDIMTSLLSNYHLTRCSFILSWGSIYTHILKQVTPEEQVHPWGNHPGSKTRSDPGQPYWEDSVPQMCNSPKQHFGIGIQKQHIIESYVLLDLYSPKWWTWRCVRK